MGSLLLFFLLVDGEGNGELEEEAGLLVGGTEALLLSVGIGVLLVPHQEE